MKLLNKELKHIKTQKIFIKNQLFKTSFCRYLNIDWNYKFVQFVQEFKNLS